MIAIRGNDNQFLVLTQISSNRPTIIYCVNRIGFPAFMRRIVRWKLTDPFQASLWGCCCLCPFWWLYEALDSIECHKWLCAGGVNKSVFTRSTVLDVELKEEITTHTQPSTLKKSSINPLTIGKSSTLLCSLIKYTLKHNTLTDKMLYIYKVKTKTKLYIYTNINEFIVLCASDDWNEKVICKL